MERKCGWNSCKFCVNGICTQKDGGGIRYGMDAVGRKKHEQQSEEVKQYCRCCVPDLGQYQKVQKSELHNVSCYCYEATDGWSQRRYLLVTEDKAKAVSFMETLCKNHGKDWNYKESDIFDSSFLNAKVLE